MLMFVWADFADSWLPRNLGSLLGLHLCGVFVVVVPLWVMAPRTPVDTALLEYTNVGGWDTKGLAALIGMVTPLNVLIGYDCTVHMGESGLHRSVKVLEETHQLDSGRAPRRIDHSAEGHHVVCRSKRLPRQSCQQSVSQS